ncbi:MAG: glycosyltransferase family 2 protein [Terriglobales bacterium]
MSVNSALGRVSTVRGDCPPVSFASGAATHADSAETSSAPKVAIIVVNWNTYAVTRECLLSLQEANYPSIDKILVDNASSDGSSERLAAEFEDVTVLRNCENLGFTGGNNVGILHALRRGAEYVLLLNNDTIVSPGFLSSMISVAEGDPEIGILNPTIYYAAAPEKIWYGGGEFSLWHGFARHRQNRKSSASSFKPSRDVTFITGCALLIKSKVIRRIGLLDDKFFMAYEDADWSVRARKAGFKAVYVAEAEIWHKESYTIRTRKCKSRRDYYNARNALIVARKHARVYHWPSFITCYVAFLLYRAGGYLLYGQLDRIAALYRGAREGLTQPLRNGSGDAAGHHAHG